MKSLLSYMLGILFLLSTSAIILHAEESMEESNLLLSSTTITPGETGVLSIEINNAIDLAGLSFDLYYDGSFFDFYSYNASGLLSNANLEVNLNHNGIIKVSLTSLEGINGSGDLINLYFSSSSDISPGAYLVDMAVGEAYDVLLNPISLDGQSGQIVVESVQETIPTVYFYSQVSKDNLSIGDTFTFSFFSYNLNNLSAGDFEIYYDHMFLTLLDVTPSSDIINSGAIISTNSSSPGFVNISLASSDSIQAIQFFTLEFAVIADSNQTIDIGLKAKNLYDVNLKPMNGTESSQLITLSQIIVKEDYPDIYITDYTGNQNLDFNVQVRLENQSLLAAGDFVIDYDHTILEVININVGDQVINHGGYLFFNQHYGEGQIGFSYINENGISLEELLLTITFRPINITEETLTQLSISGSGTVDEEFNDIQLDYGTGDIILKEPIDLPIGQGVQVNYQINYNQQMTNEFSMTVDYGVTVEFDSGSFAQESFEFLGFIEQGKVDPSFDFKKNVIATNHMDLVALFKPIDSTAIIFMDANQDYIKTLYTDELGYLNLSDIPDYSLYSKPGLLPVGWSQDTEKVFLEDTILYVEYEIADTDQLSLTVENGSGSGTYLFNETVTVQASGEGVFNYWLKDGQIASLNENYDFTMADHHTLVAVYDTNFVHEWNAFITVSPLLELRDGFVTILGQFDLSQDEELIEYGILYSYQIDDMTIDTADGKINSHKYNPNTNEFVLSLETQITEAPNYRGFIITKNRTSGEITITYSYLSP